MGPKTFSVISLSINSFSFILLIIDVVGINFCCEVVKANFDLIHVDRDFFEISDIKHSLN